jgi:hypothetical protein
MEVKMRTTGKRYGCSHCGAVSLEGTNHWGEIYSRCNSCSWKRPMDTTIKVCLEPGRLGDRGRSEMSEPVKVKVGDVIRMWEGAFGDAIVSRTYEHDTCGSRFDCVRPYALPSTVLTGGDRSSASDVVSGVPSFGFEHVDFLANDGRYKGG